MSSPAIVVHDIGKRYLIQRQRQKYQTLRDQLAAGAQRSWGAARSLVGGAPGETRTKETVWSLRGVSFEVAQGDVVGIIGHNGAGKSTLLKVLARVTEPTTGYAEVTGRVASLLEVGTGFHPELTGRENIYLNGAILGMRRAEIDRKLDSIIAFAEVEKFIETPVKHYSSGMYLRLAFSVAAHLEPEILLVDEVLAVGDMAFQAKCLGKMGEVARGGRTILFVSHNMGAVSALCNRAVLLEKGCVKAQGPVGQVVDAYLSSLQSAAAESLESRTDRGGRGETRLCEIGLVNARHETLEHVLAGMPCTLLFRYSGKEPLSRPVFKATVYNSLGQPLLAYDSSLVNAFPERLPGSGVVLCEIPKLPLSPGVYRMNASIETGGRLQDHVVAAYCFTVQHGDFYGTGRNVTTLREVCLVDQAWTGVPEVLVGRC